MAPESASTEEQVERIRARIEKLVSERFSTGTYNYYLSQLGNDLGSDREALERLSGKKLAEFIKEKFKFNIGRTGAHQNVLYLSPPGVGKVNATSTSVPRYKGRFWAAFVVPLPEGEDRFIDLKTLRFGPDSADLEAEGGEIRPIDRRFVANKDGNDPPSATLDRIREWLSEQKLEAAPFILQKSRKQDEGESLLDALLNALSGDQLKRINLPLDVVKSLSDRRLG